jgi:hypothetical protein
VLFEVSTRGLPPKSVEAPNWLAALGLGIDQLGVVAAIDRLACEVLPNGKVLARDVRSGLGFVVAPRRPEPVILAPDDEPTVLLTEGESQELIAVAEEAVSEDIAPLPDEALEVLPASDDELFAQLARLPTASRAAARQALAALREAVSEAVASEHALDLARRLVPCLAGSVILAADDRSLRFVAVAGPKSELLRGVRLPAGKGIAGFCVERGSSLSLTRPRRDPRFYAEVDQITGLDTESILCVPVGERAPTRGCMELLNPRAGQFEPTDLQLVLRVAHELEARLKRRP